MSESDALDVIQKKMLDLLEARKNISEWSEKRPTNWRPSSVTNPNPDVNIPFTNTTCWYFIEQLLHNKHPIKEITLDKPPGKKGYMMLFETESEPSDIYIKLEIANGQLIGRSFHYSDWSK